MSSQSLSNKAPRGRPRLPLAVRSRIVQLRGSNRTRPPSIDAILDKLEEEGIVPPPARGTVHNVIREWEKQPEEIRTREFPFEWQHLDEARIPWESSKWILRCYQQQHQSQLETVDFARSQHMDLGTLYVVVATFTNRLATWCWRVHLAAPDLNPKDVLTLALWSAALERMQDLPTAFRVDETIDTTMLQDWLALRPDMEQRYGLAGARQRYWDAVDLGLVKKPIPKTRDEAEQYMATMLGSQKELGMFRRPGAEHYYTGPSPVTIWAILNGEPLVTETTTETKESKEVHP